MPTYVSPFTGTVVTPTDVSYFYLAFSTDQQLAWPAQINAPEVPAARIIDCVAGTTGLTVALPPANQGTQGADILFRNLGSNSFVITDAAGGETVTLAAGQAYYFYLTDNTTIGGNWNNIAFGVGTSFADATSLAGYGLTTANGKLATTQNIADISSTPNLDNTSRATTYVWAAPSGVGEINLPDPQVLSTGWYIGFRNNGTGTLNINATAPSSINGQLTIATNPGDSGMIMLDSNTGSYVTLGWTPPTNAVFSAATYDVDSVVSNTLSLVADAPIIQTYISQSGTRLVNLDVVLPNITQIYVLVNNTNQSGYNIIFYNEGYPANTFVLGNNTVAVVLSDGIDLYLLTQSASSSFISPGDGTAASPAFTFQNDPQTGMYLAGTSVLGFSSNGVNMLSLDNTNTLAPVSIFNSRLVADLIDGGTF